MYLGAAEYFDGRTDVQCLHRWQKVLNPEVVKGPWTPEVSYLASFFWKSLPLCYAKSGNMSPGLWNLMLPDDNFSRMKAASNQWCLIQTSMTVL